MRAGDWRIAVTRAAHGFSADRCADLAAALTYRATLALFPAIIAVFALLGLVGQDRKAADEVLGIIESVAPTTTSDALRAPIEQLTRAPGAGLALVFGIAVALWAASGYVDAFGRAMNAVYAVEEGRPFWARRAAQLIVTLIIVVAAAISAVAVLLSGGIADAVGQRLGMSPVMLIVSNVLKWPLVVGALVMAVAVLYHYTPNVKHVRLRWVSPGAIVAIVALAGGSGGLALYAADGVDYRRTYGSLAGIVLFLLWLWIVNLALLLGAEFDAELERVRQLRAGLVAERHLQLPLRDTRAVDRRGRMHARDIDRARALRERSPRDHDSAR